MNQIICSVYPVSADKAVDTDHIERAEENYIYKAGELDAIINRRSLIRRIVDSVLSIFREIGSLLKERHPCAMLSNFIAFWRGDHRYDDLSKPKAWKENSEGLYVMVAGLKASPAIWEEHRVQLNREKPHCDTLIPYVPKEGNCCLEESADPILNKIIEYSNKNPGKPICIMGASNGGRIAHYLETELREKKPGCKVIISTIAGVHYGSQRMELINNSAIIRYVLGLCPEVCRELSFGSEKAKSLLDRVNQPIEPSQRRYSYFATTEDLLATHNGTSLPLTKHRCIHQIVHGEGHTSIISRVRDYQLNQAYEWMSKDMD